MFDIIQPKTAGWLGLDADVGINKKERGNYLSSGGRVLKEQRRFLYDNQVDFMVEPGNALFWGHDHITQLTPRGAWGSWSFAMPYITQAGASGHPMQLANVKDPDFRSDIVFQQQSYGGELPLGLWGIAAATTNHGPRDKIGVISGGPLVAHWRGNQPPTHSRHVFDIQGSNLDPKRHAGLHSVFEVRKWDFPCQAMGTSSVAFQDLYAIALNGRTSADGTGNLFTTFPDFDAHLSHNMNGPLRPATKKHRFAVTSDGPIHAGAIDTNAYYTGGREPWDGPMEFIEDQYPIVKEGVTPYKVYLKFDTSADHSFRCGNKLGVWKWYVKLPVSETPPCDATKDYSTVDSNSNPLRTYAESTRLVLHQKAISTGIYMQPRSNILSGRLRK